MSDCEIVVALPSFIKEVLDEGPFAAVKRGNVGCL